MDVSTVRGRMAKSNEALFWTRLKSGRCPVHGLLLMMVGVWVNKRASGHLESCPRKSCNTVWTVSYFGEQVVRTNSGEK